MEKDALFEDSSPKSPVAVRQQASHTITGNDMAEFINELQNGGLFANKNEVQKIVVQRNAFLDKLLEKLAGIMEDFQKRMPYFEKPIGL